MTLRFSEKFLLLSLDEEKQTFPPSASAAVKYGLVGAVLYELIEGGKLKLVEENLEPVDLQPVGDTILDAALEEISKSSKSSKVQHWISKLSRRAEKFKNLLLKNLLDKGIVKEIDNGGKGPLSRKRFRLWYERPLAHTRQGLQDTVIYGKEGDPGTLTLLALIYACKLTGRVFKGADHRQGAAKRVKELSESHIFAKAIRGTITGAHFTIVFGLLSAVAMLLKEVCS